MAGRSCLACGASLEGTRQVKFCANNGKCKMRWHRGARATPEAAAEDADRIEVDGIESTTAATLVELAEAGRLGTPLAQAALVIAHRLDHSHQDTGAGVASLAKQLEATLAAATVGANAPKSALQAHRDELAARRARKAQ